MSPIGSIASSYLQSILSNATGSHKTSGTGTTQVSAQPDNTQLSPFAQMLSELQQLQQSDPTKYQQVTGQIATNLQSAASTAQANGNTQAATQLNQLATDFSNASQNGQLPNIQDLAQAVGGGHHHHHHSHSQATAFQNAASQDASLNPTAIVLNTLASAGIGS